MEAGLGIFVESTSLLLPQKGTQCFNHCLNEGLAPPCEQAEAMWVGHVTRNPDGSAVDASGAVEAPTLFEAAA